MRKVIPPHPRASAKARARQATPAVALDPAAFQRRGIEAARAGRLAEAAGWFERLLALEPDSVEALTNLGLILARQGQTEAAIARYRAALGHRPDQPETLNNLGLALETLGRPEEAAEAYRRALGVRPAYPGALYNLGNALRRLGQTEAAIGHYRQALALDPAFAQAFNNLGTALKELGRFDEAIASLEQATRAAPAWPEAHFNLGNAQKERGRLEAAVAAYREALRLRPDFPGGLNNLGNVLRELDRHEEAAQCYRQALDQRPDEIDALNNLGQLLQELGRLEEAIACFRRALALRPDKPVAHVNLGQALHGQGLIDEAQGAFHDALACDPANAAALLGLCLNQLPVLYQYGEEIARRRADYHRHLELLSERFDQRPPGPGREREWLEAIVTRQPFFLAYQGCNDRPLQSLYGALIARIVATRFPPLASLPRPLAGEKIRVGIVCGFFRFHSVWKIPLKGWMTGLDRQRFRLFGYHTGARRDAITDEAAGLCERFVQGPMSTEQWRREILADAPHVLIYPDIGMDPATLPLAAQRLAAVQCQALGHPETSGLPTIDYCLSSDLMEPLDAQDHYTETVVRLPNLSLYHEPIPATEVAPLTRAELGWPETSVIYWSGQSLYKYLPQYDQVFARIARAAGDCRFVFIAYQKSEPITEIFRARLRRAFAEQGLSADQYCIFLPRLSWDRFLGAIGCCDAVLDSIGWSGHNSTLEGLTHGLPIVTLPGPLMRGRHTLAMLRMMGVEDTVAESLEDYVALAVRLAREPAWRAEIRGKIAEAKPRLYRDQACIRGVERFLEVAVREDVHSQGALPPDTPHQRPAGLWKPGIEGGEAYTSGVRAGKAEALVRVMEGRYGPLPVAVRERVGAAGEAALNHWLDRLAGAASLAELMDSEAP